jgi:hypothetical protein
MNNLYIVHVLYLHVIVIVSEGTLEKRLHCKTGY